MLTVAEAVSMVNATQAALGACRDAEEREKLKVEMARALDELRAAKERQKAENARRNFAGLGSPLHEACVAKLDAATVAELEEDALARQDQRDTRAAERRAAKVPAAAPTPQAGPGPEVYTRRGAP